MEKTIEDVVEITCLVRITDSGARVFGVKYQPSTNSWLEIDITDFLPLDEVLRIEALATSEKRKHYHQIGKVKGLW